MTKLSARSWAILSCGWLGVLGTVAACGSDNGSTPGGTGVAGSPNTAGTVAIAGSSGSAGASAGSSGVDAAGRAAAGSGGSGGTVTPTAGSGSGAAGASVAAGSGGAGRGGAGIGGNGGGGSGGRGGAGGMSGGGSGGRAGGGGGGSGGSGSTATGDGGVVNATIVVKAGQTFDGGGKRYTAGTALGDGSQDEGQDPVFKLEDGARLINVVLGSPAADGIHCHGDATLENITWEDIGEDAMTIKESGTVTLDGGSASNGEDKVFQINAESTFRVSNFTAKSAGKFIRQNGDTTFKVQVFIDKCDISDMDEAIFRTDSSSSTVEMTNTRYSNIGDELFIGVSSGNIKQTGNTEY